MDLILLENGSIRVILNAELSGEDRIFDVSNVFRSADRRINRDPRPRERERESSLFVRRIVITRNRRGENSRRSARITSRKPKEGGKRSAGFLLYRRG